MISLQEYLEKIFSTYSTDELSYFEMNLETWRQLWRVLEMSDIILMIADIRYPVRLDTCIYNIHSSMIFIP
jgi:ribosome biogenesis GTPase A